MEIADVRVSGDPNSVFMFTRKLDPQGDLRGPTHALQELSHALCVSVTGFISFQKARGLS